MSNEEGSKMESTGGPSALNAALEAMEQFSETLGGLRRSLIAQGFSDKAAEEIVVSWAHDVMVGEA